MEEGDVYVCGNVTWETSLIKNKQGKDDTMFFTPRRLIGGPAKAAKVRTGSSALHCFLITAAGELYAFGRNFSGQLGLGRVSPAVHVPAKVSGIGSASNPVVDAACGKNHSVFLLQSGEVYAAGANSFGQLGHGNVTEMSTKPVKTKLPSGKKGKAIAAGLDFSLVLTEDGEVYSFGCGEFGKLGIGTDGAHNTSASSIKLKFDAFPTPKLVKGIEDVRLIAAGNHHALAATRDKVYAWGSGSYGRLGLGATKNKDCWRPEPCYCTGWIAMSKRLAEGKSLFKMLSAGRESSLAVLNDRQVTYAWGKVKATQPEADMYPKILHDLQGWEIRSISLGNGFITTCSERSVIAWGAGTEGNLGLGDPPKFPKSSAQARKVDPLEGATTLCLAAGANHTLFVVKPEESSAAILGKLVDYVPVDPPQDVQVTEDASGGTADARKRKSLAPKRGRPKRGRGR